MRAAGYNYEAIQALVNEMLGGGSSAPKKSVAEVAKEVIAGQWGNGDDRKKRLTSAGYNYDQVQAKVNELLGYGSGRESNDTIVNQVIQGLWGNGDDRARRLAAAGYDYNAIQALVNQKLGYGGGASVRVGSNIRIGYNARDLNTGAFYAPFVYNTVYRVLEISGRRVVFGNAAGAVIGATDIGNVSLA